MGSDRNGIFSAIEAIELERASDRLAWATSRSPELDDSAAMAALWKDIAIATRLGSPDPVTSWRERFAELAERARRLSGQRFDAVRLRGPGTELEIGLLPGVQWVGPTNVSERGILHAWNLPSEEVYTSPDPLRAHGYVRLTRPAVIGGSLAHDVTLTFRDGQVVEIDGGEGVERLRAFVDRDAGARRLGELALVDGESAVASVRQPFGLILLDENAASHIALGFGFPELGDARTGGRVNTSGEHLDLTIGGPHLQITGLSDHEGGIEAPLIRDGAWILG